MGDGRQSGGGPSILNVSPESAVGGNLALLETGDTISVDLNSCSVELQVSDASWLSAGRLPPTGTSDTLAGDLSGLCGATHGRLSRIGYEISGCGRLHPTEKPLKKPGELPGLKWFSDFLLTKQFGLGLRLDQLARLVEVVVHDRIRMNAERVVDGGQQFGGMNGIRIRALPVLSDLPTFPRLMPAPPITPV